MQLGAFSISLAVKNLDASRRRAGRSCETVTT